MKKSRQPDGTFRGPRQPSKLTQRTLHARWLEEEVMKLKLLGVASFNAIAFQVTRVGRGAAQPVVELPLGLKFSENYSISGVACYRACQRGLARGPRLRAQEMRDIDADRLEDAILASQKGVKQGDPQSVQALARLISVRARLLGYMSPGRVELTGKAGGPVATTQINDFQIEQMLGRLSEEEQLQFINLYNKASGFSAEAGPANDSNGGSNEERTSNQRSIADGKQSQLDGEDFGSENEETDGGGFEPNGAD